MVYTDDFFVRDEIAMEMNSKATESTVDKLKKTGIDMARGYYFYKPHELLKSADIHMPIRNQ